MEMGTVKVQISMGDINMVHMYIHFPPQPGTWEGCKALLADKASGTPEVRSLLSTLFAAFCCFLLLCFVNIVLGSWKHASETCSLIISRVVFIPFWTLLLLPPLPSPDLSHVSVCSHVDPLQGAGGDLVHLLRSFVIGLEGACKSVGNDLTPFLAYLFFVP